MTGHGDPSGQLLRRKWPWASLLIFAVAMGVLEGIVAIYLRDLYYPKGFVFPLTPLSSRTVLIESLREAATIFMLAAIGHVAGRSLIERFSLFVYVFGVWDIVYYGTLLLIIQWPSSLLTWDVLFLIPVTWLGPVLAPLVCSCTMIILTLSIQRRLSQGVFVSPAPLEYIACLVGSTLIFLSFIWEYGRLIIGGGFLPRFLTLADDPQFREVISRHVPTTYHWSLLIVGEGFIFLSIVLLLHRTRPNSSCITSP
jgi:hypothetical protein